MNYDSSHEYLCGVYVNKIKQYNTRIMNKLIQEMGIDSFTCEQSFVLSALWHADGQTCSELADNTGLAANTITALVNNLVKSQLVIRRSSDADRRQTLIFLTQQGRDARQQFNRVLEKVIGIGFANFSDKDYECFQKLLARLSDNYRNYFQN